MPIPMARPPKRHQIRAEAVPFHHDEGEERRERQDQRDDDRTAHIGEQNDENDQDENRAFFERLGHGVDRLLYQIGAVIKRNQLDTFRQCFLNRGKLFFDRFDHIATARPFQHQHDSGDGFAFTVRGHRALPQLRADFHLRHITDVNRRVLAASADDDVLDVAHVFHQSEPAHDILLGLMFDEVAARVGVVFFQRLEDLLQA